MLEVKAIFSSSVGFRAWKGSVGRTSGLLHKTSPLKADLFPKLGFASFPFENSDCLMANWLFSAVEKQNKIEMCKAVMEMLSFISFLSRFETIGGDLGASTWSRDGFGGWICRDSLE